MKRAVCLLLLLCFVNLPAIAQDTLEEQVAGELRTWRHTLEMHYIDYEEYPATDSILALAEYCKKWHYWDNPVLYDPWGNEYKYSSDGSSYEIISPGPDGTVFTEDDMTIQQGSNKSTLSPRRALLQRLKQPRKLVPIPMAASSLMLKKSGDDIVFNWSTTGTSHDITGSMDKKFLNSYMIAYNQAGTSYTYTGALVNGRDIEFFDVTDEDGGNRAEDPNGYLPPPPPEITTISTAPFIGGSGTITGTNFSDVTGDNIICFDGGYCIHPDTATTTQLDFTVPPGALSGPVSVAGGTLVSNTVDVKVEWEDPAYSDMIIRTLGFSESAGDFWGGVSDGGSKVYRLYYDGTNDKWAREDRSGGFTDIHYCSTKTDRFNRLFCGRGNAGDVAWVTRYVSTDPVGNLSPCLQVSSPNNNWVTVAGAAADPNPDAVGGRDVAYFAFRNTSTGENYIRKIASDCSGTLDSDYGNLSGAWNFQSLVGMAVDPVNGDLYVSEGTQISVVHTDESVELFKAGFTQILGIDVWRKSSNDFGILVVADFTDDVIQAVPLDNPSIAPVTVASGNSMRTTPFGYTTYDDTTWESSNLLRLFILHNDGSSMIPRREPFLMVSGSSDNGVPIWLSAPDTLDLANHQGAVRLSDPSSTDYSTFRIKATWADGMERPLYVILGDALSTATYEPRPADTTPCFNPWSGALCDNHESFSATGGVGSSTDSNTYYDSSLFCGSSLIPCSFDFRISQRYAGDNYRAYFYPHDPTVEPVGAIGSTLYSAWKRVYIEQDKMCRGGGMLWEDESREPDAQAGDSVIYLAKNPDGTRADNVSLNDVIHIFDADRPYEENHDTACVQAIDDTSDTRWVKITLGNPTDCPQAKTLSYSYDASVPNPADGKWDFSVGKSAGVCVDGLGFYAADSSQLNKRDRQGPFDDGYVQFSIRDEGSGVVPYLPPEFFDAYELDVSCPNKKPRSGYDTTPWFRFGKLWFENRSRYNYLQLIGAVKTQQLDSCMTCFGTHPLPQINGVAGSDGATGLYYRTVFTFRGSLEYPCATADEITNATQDVSAHEIGHDWYVNPTLAGEHDTNCHWVASGQGCGALPVCGSITDACVMNVSRDRWDNIIRFCYDNLICGDSGCPNGDPGCCSGCSLEGNGTVRLLEDPLIGTQP